jgi:heptosyltransferase-1
MKICIVKLSAMGDIIHSQVVLQFIKEQLPQTQIDWVVEESFSGILENNPHIDNILTINLKSIKKNKLAIFEQIKLLNSYAKNNYDIVIDAQGLLKSAIVSVIIGRRIIGSKIVGFDKDSIRESMASWFYDDKVNIAYEKNVIDRNCKLISKALNIIIEKKDILKKKAFLFSTSTIELRYDIVFVVGASKENKIYPKEKFLELSQRLDKKILAVWGNDEEYAIVHWLNEQNKQIQIAPKGSLNDLIGIISNSKLVIGADTGPTHIAWAVNTPSITIFGNTPEYRNTYITDINKVIKSDSYVNPLKLDKNDFSIKEIKAKDIYDLAKELLVG